MLSVFVREHLTTTTVLSGMPQTFVTAEDRINYFTLTVRSRFRNRICKEFRCHSTTACQTQLVVLLTRFLTSCNPLRWRASRGL